LLAKADERAIAILASKLRTNLQSGDPTFVDRIFPLIYAHSYISNESTENAESILKEIL